jgi:hypothetical protein
MDGSGCGAGGQPDRCDERRIAKARQIPIFPRPRAPLTRMMLRLKRWSLPTLRSISSRKLSVHRPPIWA